jgi:adenylyltransferase/sulfurtransferase
MDGQNLSADALQEQISATEKKLAELKEQLRKIEDTDKAEAQPDATSTAAGSEKWPLTPEEYNRYGRQMIVPSIGLKGKHDIVTCLQ